MFIAANLKDWPSNSKSCRLLLPRDQEADDPLRECADFNVDLHAHVERELRGNLQCHVRVNERDVKQHGAGIEEVDGQVKPKGSATGFFVRTHFIDFPVRCACQKPGLGSVAPERQRGEGRPT